MQMAPGTLRPGRVPVTPVWNMKREMLSPSYTTRLDQLWTVKCQWELSAGLRGHSDNLSAGDRFQLSHFEQQALVYRSNPG
ncbi:DUF4113 domain-containing protein [Pusillimonas minor]|uniref:DUF4113 domain-containing protein n=1 Tax=Pusillimonas minor TaxID=2697024 RepID=A0A842HTX4_9BURK|nr:DUF4113 domain-containing protein [Pusillimonas minor]